jgi:hypothetical protein
MLWEKVIAASYAGVFGQCLSIHLTSPFDHSDLLEENPLRSGKTLVHH